MTEREKINFENVPKYKNNVSQNLEAIKQIQKKIDLTHINASNTKFQKYENELKEKNTYFSRSKIKEINEKDISLQQTKMTNKFKGVSNLNNEEDDGYCPKCPSQKNFCPHKNQKEQLKEKYSYPICSNASYGWLPPVDTLKDNYNINSITKSFYDNSHL